MTGSAPDPTGGVKTNQTQVNSQSQHGQAVQMGEILWGWVVKSEISVGYFTCSHYGLFVVGGYRRIPQWPEGRIRERGEGVPSVDIDVCIS